MESVWPARTLLAGITTNGFGDSADDVRSGSYSLLGLHDGMRRVYRGDGKASLRGYLISISLSFFHSFIHSFFWDRNYHFLSQPKISIPIQQQQHSSSCFSKPSPSSPSWPLLSQHHLPHQLIPTTKSPLHQPTTPLPSTTPLQLTTTTTTQTRTRESKPSTPKSTTGPP